MIIFQHLAKTGGTTLGGIFRHVIPPEHHLPIDVHTRQTALGTWSDDDVRNSIRNRSADEVRQARLLGGHVGFGIHKFLSVPAKYITILRDPVERLLSGYYYSIGRHEEATGEKVSLEDYVFRKRHYDLGLDNYQCRVVSGRPDLDPLGAVTTADARAVTMEDLHAAERNLRQHYVMVGVTERFDHFVVALARLFRFDLEDVVYRKENVTPCRRARTEIADYIVAEIRRRNAYDERLYESAAALFERTVASFGDSFADELLLFKRLNVMFQSGCTREAIREEERRHRRRENLSPFNTLRRRFFSGAPLSVPAQVSSS